jgi:hypothetical protein
MSDANEITRETGKPTLAGKARFLLGLLMMISGLYFGLFSAGAGEGLGFLSFLASPFVIMTDR